MLEQQQHQ